jgi:hypothetical protein
MDWYGHSEERPKLYLIAKPLFAMTNLQSVCIRTTQIIYTINYSFVNINYNRKPPSATNKGRLSVKRRSSPNDLSTLILTNKIDLANITVLSLT